MKISTLNNNSEAFKRLFRDYFDKLYAYSAGLYRDEMLAEDAVQEAFISLWNARNKVTWDASAYPYLLKTVKNGFINYKLHEDVKRRYTEETLHLESDTVDWDLPEEVEELHRSLWEAIERLPESCRHTFIMSCIEGMKYKEIAEQTSVSINTVKTQIQIGYKKIRTNLKISAINSIRLLAAIGSICQPLLRF
ncbi:RNA polymerase sigma-70 factor [Proteiniphilum sp. UBA5384]|uniref:RNA polymerase sigma-70 factor n=1 Tax=Proteiniphilum sp. UBA5384 TaxID=1947279 RepID=UPI0025DA9331|nr:RNA polymerase sigma-70 factor [Proteiniphilum sp. UBA5384]